MTDGYRSRIYERYASRFQSAGPEFDEHGVKSAACFALWQGIHLRAMPWNLTKTGVGSLVCTHVFLILAVRM